jgi:bifunctional N-acetylglucosamine-1-phosphate-uridyltransferase/glucosamine-1-phosphate-acetyltransferase GlmU-like protein
MKVIILAGGKGTRLWPVSREKYSKQFLKLVDSTPLIETSYQRALKVVGPEDIVTITNKDYYFYTKEVCDKFSKVLSQNIITEPVGKNTAPAIALSVQYLIDKLNAIKDEVVYVFTSDHIIKPLEKFIVYMEAAKNAANKGYLVTFGIKPTKPETGYGYIKIGEGLGDFNKVDYNIGGGNEWKNIDLVNLICEILAEITGKPVDEYKKLITFVKDRLGHDRRHALGIEKIKNELEWKPDVDFVEGIKKTVKWFFGKCYRDGINRV